MSDDVKMVRVTAVGAATDMRTRIVAVNVVHTSAGAGRLTITNGNGGDVLLDLDFAGVLATDSVAMWGKGILFPASAYVSVATNITAATIFYVG